MASTSETGHAKNLASLNELITVVDSYGPTYNPKESIQLPALKLLWANSKKVNDEVNAAHALYSNAVSAHKIAFKPFGKSITKVFNALKASDTPVEVDETAKTIVRKIQGTRATAKKTEEEKKALLALGKETKEISTSQMGIDNRLENYDRLIQLLDSNPLYKPNEEELKVATLKAHHAGLKAKTDAKITADIAYKNTCINRNIVFYKDLTGLYDLTYDVKVYIKSVFGASSPQYKQVSKIKFTKPIKL